MAINCWEFKNCGREPKGKNAAEKGVCPAAITLKATGINDGTNGGRACWCIAGTYCGGIVQGTFSNKILNCVNCDFFQKVWKEQHDKNSYMEAKEILDRLR